MNKQIKVFYRYQTKEEIVESTSLCKIRIFFFVELTFGHF